MSAQPLPQVDQAIYMVAQWKDELDPVAPWWQRWFYRFVYVPFNEIALRVFKIPRATEVLIEGQRVSFRWWEVEGFFASEDEADVGCLSERWSYKDYPFGRLMTPESGQYGRGPIFPRAKNPRKRERPILDHSIVPRRELHRLRDKVQETELFVRRYHDQ